MYLTKEQIQELDNIPIMDVAILLGLEIKKNDEKAYKCLHQGGCFIFPADNKFFSFTIKLAFLEIKKQ